MKALSNYWYTVSVKFLSIVIGSKLTMNQEEVTTVHIRDLERLLEQFALLDSFRDGTLRCKFCKTTLNVDNIYSILPEAGTAHGICDEPECVTLLMQHVEELQKKTVA